jgi:hypothetical protein
MNKVNEAGYNESTKFGPSENNPPMSMFDKKYDLKDKEFIKPLPSTYSIPIYENGIKTEWSVDGVVGDEKYQQLIEMSPEGKLPVMINTNTNKINENRTNSSRLVN